MKENFIIFLDIDGVFSTKDALDQLWGSIVGFQKKGYEDYFSYHQSLKGYKRVRGSMYNWPFCEQAVFNYHKLQYIIYSKLDMIPVTVLCSSWRHSYRHLEECKAELVMKKLNLLYLQGFTGHASSRGDEIKEYCEIFKINKNFIVIDDECSYDIDTVIDKKHLIQPSFKTGFDDNMFAEAKDKIRQLVKENKK